MAEDVGGDEALIEGVLRISGDCVVLDERGEDVLLVWPVDSTDWNVESRSIDFDRQDGSVATLSDGESVALGGGGSSVLEDGLNAEDWFNTVDWVAPPPSHCVTDTRWFVSEVIP